ncbi:MAG: response regulator [Phycisphaeraceae bacterium]|nr:response regulator [Phycisphaeraceae bacterium]
MAGRKVLVVDDEIHIVHVVTIKLRNSGFEVITAESGQEAYELACREQPDVIITDHQMPNMTGLELLEKLRNHGPTQRMPAVVLTTQAHDLSEEECLRLGIHQCMSKPFSPRELLREVENILYGAPVIISQTLTP